MSGIYTDPDHQHYFGERESYPGLPYRADVFCLCGHAEDVHDNIEMEDERCAMESCPCRKFEIRPEL